MNSWKEFIKAESEKDYYKVLLSRITDDSKSYIIHPPRFLIFNAFESCPIDEVKIVILGQDPYHGPDQAHGMAFSVLPKVDVPPSLINIFKEIKSDLSIDIDKSNGYLQPWAQQGVLLLNASLTVRNGQAGSHKNFGWMTFTDNAIKLLNDRSNPIAFMLWGAFAKSKKELITNPKHLILEAAHPSPLSAHNGFFGCKHFSKANEFLEKNNLTKIDWSL